MARLFGQIFDGLGEIQALKVHDKAKRIAAGAAAEAIIELLVRADAEGGRLFIMKRAQRRVVFTGFLEFQARANDLDDIGPSEKVIDKALRNKPGHVSALHQQKETAHERLGRTCDRFGAL